jgi:hypothetical protein
VFVYGWLFSQDSLPEHDNRRGLSLQAGKFPPGINGRPQN